MKRRLACEEMLPVRTTDSDTTNGLRRLADVQGARARTHGERSGPEPLFEHTHDRPCPGSRCPENGRLEFYPPQGVDLHQQIVGISATISQSSVPLCGLVGGRRILGPALFTFESYGVGNFF